MLTVIPGKEYKELTGNSINEDSKTECFDWDEMMKHSSSYEEIFNYIKYLKDVQYVGEGSGRIAFFLKNSLENSELGPACFKLAKNKKGIAQTKAEINFFNKYKEITFPKVYKYDDKNYFFELVEFGLPLTDAIEMEMLDLYDFFKDWNMYAREIIKEDSHNITDFKITEYDFLNIEEAICGNEFDLIFNLISKYVGDHPAGIDRLTEEQRKVADDVINKIEEKFQQKYGFLISFIRFIKDHKNEFGIADFKNENNWGVVQRDDVIIIIPIDWGLSWEVAEEYYR